MSNTDIKQAKKDLLRQMLLSQTIEFAKQHNFTGKEVNENSRFCEDLGFKIADKQKLVMCFDNTFQIRLNPEQKNRLIQTERIGDFVDFYALSCLVKVAMPVHEFNKQK